MSTMRRTISYLLGFCAITGPLPAQDMRTNWDKKISEFESQHVLKTVQACVDLGDLSRQFLNNLKDEPAAQAPVLAKRLAHLAAQFECASYGTPLQGTRLAPSGSMAFSTRKPADFNEIQDASLLSPGSQVAQLGRFAALVAKQAAESAAIEMVKAAGEGFVNEMQNQGPVNGFHDNAAVRQATGWGYNGMSEPVHLEIGNRPYPELPEHENGVPAATKAPAIDDKLLDY